MFFTLSKALIFLLDPIVWVVIGFAVSIFSKNIKRKRLFLVSTFVVLLLLTNPFLSQNALKKWEASPVLKSDLPLCDIGIVLTGMTYSDSKMQPDDQLHFNESADRITEAIMLMSDGLIKDLVISGGTVSPNENAIAESLALEQLLIASNVKPKNYHLETSSKNTYENAKYCSEYLQSRNLTSRKILLITSAFHMPRAIACFEKQGIHVIPFPVDFKTHSTEFSLEAVIPSSACLNDWRMLIKECIGIIMYKTAGYI